MSEYSIFILIYRENKHKGNLVFRYGRHLNIEYCNIIGKFTEISYALFLYGYYQCFVYEL